MSNRNTLDFRLCHLYSVFSRLERSKKEKFTCVEYKKSSLSLVTHRATLIRRDFEKSLHVQVSRDLGGYGNQPAESNLRSTSVGESFPGRLVIG